MRRGQGMGGQVLSKVQAERAGALAAATPATTAGVADRATAAAAALAAAAGGLVGTWRQAATPAARAAQVTR